MIWYAFPIQNLQHIAWPILEGDLEEVSLSWLTSPYLELREKWKCIECIGKSKIDQNFSLKSWNCRKTSPSLKALGWTLILIFFLISLWFLFLPEILDKRRYQVTIFFISLWKQKLWCSLEVPHWGTSKGTHSISFHREIRKISKFFGWEKKTKKPPYLELWKCL